jgi:nitroreductase
MNRRTFLKTVPAIGILGVTDLSFSQDSNNVLPDANQPIQTADVIKLNPPDLDAGISLMQALKKRKSSRDITDKKLTLRQLSDLLWSADGANRPDGKRTSPAAMGIYCVDIYVVLPEGIYLYDSAKQELNLIAKGDFRKSAGSQDFVFTAPVNLVYTFTLKNPPNRPPAQIPEDKRKMWGVVEVGCMVQNVYLYCASQGLGSVVRGMLDEKKIAEILKIKPDQILVAQTIGYTK